MPHRRDTETLDLLQWQPPEIVRRYEEERVRGATLRARTARAISEALRDCGKSRQDVAAAMSVYLDERVSKQTLDGYASTARPDNAISFVRLIALVQVTADVRPLQLAAEVIDHAVIERRWLAAVEEARWADAAEVAIKNKKRARRRWKGDAR